jgi:hypothetical protein
MNGNSWVVPETCTKTRITSYQKEMRKGGYGVYTKSKKDKKRISKYFAPLSEPGDDPMQEWSSLSRPGYSETEERKVIIIVGEKCICLL